MQVRLITAAVVVSLLAPLSAQASYDFTAPVPLHTIANFDPSNGVVPFPNNLLLQGTTDLTLNIPVADPTAPSAAPTAAMNALDGFSTTAPWTTTFSQPLDPSSLAGNVRVFQVELSGPGGAVTKIDRELQMPLEFFPTTTGDGRTLAIVPTSPLQQLTSYMAVVTTGVKTAAGDGVRPSLVYALAERTSPVCTADGRSAVAFLPPEQACALEPLRQLTNAQEAAAAAAGIAPGSIAISWTATTQSITPSLQAIESVVEQSPPAPTRTVPVDTFAHLGLPGDATLFIGTIDLPYYLSAPTADDPAAPLTASWRAAPGAYVPPFDQAGLDPTSTNVTFANPLPVATSTQTVPFMLTVPDTEMPAAGWPVVIFQHGITRNRTDMLAIAGTLAAQGFAVIAIDLPLHGVTDPNSPFYAGNFPAQLGSDVHERTFDLDLQDNATGAPGPDGVIDASGSHFINLTSLLTSRDNLREGAADLLVLAHAIPSMQAAPPLGFGKFDATRISFVGQSLGSIVGGLFMAVEPNVRNAVLNVPGGGIVNLLVGSPTFGPQINAGLAAAGVEPGTPDYAQFLLAAQTAIDAGDPINYTTNNTLITPPAIGEQPAKNLLVQEVVGSDGFPPDQVIPNRVEGAPLSGTEPLIRALGLGPIDATTQSDTGVSGAVRFLQGEHGSILDPTDFPAVTGEMQGEMVSFVASGGTAVQVQNPAVVQPTPPVSCDPLNPPCPGE